MPRNQRRQANRIPIGDFWDSEYAAQQLTPPLSYKSSVRHLVRNHVDPIVLKRGFMLQNFQFILRFDLLSANTSQGLPQGQRRLLECLQSTDGFVPWEAVHSVVMRTTFEKFKCPICLETPIAPRITECGHVYCLPCILQYLSLQKRSNLARICPVCQSSVAAFTLRPCVLKLICPLEVGHTARFDLFHRERDTCLLRRYDDPWLQLNAADRSFNKSADFTNQSIELKLALPHYADPYSMQSRYVLTTEEYEVHQRCVESERLLERLAEIGFLPRPMGEADAATEHFLLKAFDEVQKDHKAPPSSCVCVSSPLAPRPYQPASSKNQSNESRIVELYAEAEGQSYYLHMVSANMIKHDANLRGVPLPTSVVGKVVEIVSLVQDKDTRRIYKVFANVPLHSSINLCILDLKDVVLPETLHAFKEKLDALASKRYAKQRADDEASVAGANLMWQQYMQKYTPHVSSPSVLHSDDHSYETDSIPFLHLPSSGSGWSDHGLPPNPLDTRQRATKKQDGDVLTPLKPSSALSCLTPGFGSMQGSESPKNCWSSGSGAKLFKVAKLTTVSDASKKVSAWSNSDGKTLHTPEKEK